MNETLPISEEAETTGSRWAKYSFASEFIIGFLLVVSVYGLAELGEYLWRGIDLKVSWVVLISLAFRIKHPNRIVWWLIAANTGLAICYGISFEGSVWSRIGLTLYAGSYLLPFLMWSYRMELNRRADHATSGESSCHEGATSP
jgi:hypothetical protein